MLRPADHARRHECRHAEAHPRRDDRPPRPEHERRDPTHDQEYEERRRPMAPGAPRQCDERHRPEEWIDDRDPVPVIPAPAPRQERDRKSTRLNSSHLVISYAVFCLKKKKKQNPIQIASKDKRTTHIK